MQRVDVLSLVENSGQMRVDHITQDAGIGHYWTVNQPTDTRRTPGKMRKRPTLDGVGSKERTLWPALWSNKFK